MSRAFCTRCSTQDGLLIVEIAGDAVRARSAARHWRSRERIRHLRAPADRRHRVRQGPGDGAGFLGVLYGILARMHPNIPRELREEMRGVADGAQVPYRDVLLINCFDDVLHALIQLNPVLAPLLHHRFVKPVLGWLGAPPTPAAGLRLLGVRADRDGQRDGRADPRAQPGLPDQRRLRRSGRYRPARAARERGRLRGAPDARAAVRLGGLAGFRRAGDGAERRRPLAGLPDFDGLAGDGERHAAAAALPDRSPSTPARSTR